ncbi:MAG: asparaginase domain-containing protein [Planctomycetota bacterium]
MHHIELLTTGGTIEKTYDEASQELANTSSIVPRMLRRLKLPQTQIHVRELMHKDSLSLTDADRQRIVQTATMGVQLTKSIVVLHGTDTLSDTGELLHGALGDSGATIVMTGAMRPYEMKRSDALQNLTEALLASTLLSPGVYCVMHGQALRFPGVRKDVDRGTFIST